MIKKVPGKCTHCGMPIEFSADAIGSVTKCPYCRKETELLLAVPETDSRPLRRAIIWTVVAAVILILGLIGALAALKRAERMKGGRASAVHARTSLSVTTPAGPLR